jgi:hypothetical protein
MARALAGTMQHRKVTAAFEGSGLSDGVAVLAWRMPGVVDAVLLLCGYHEEVFL